MTEIKLTDEEKFKLRLINNYYSNLFLTTYYESIEFIAEFKLLCNKYNLNEGEMTKKYLFKKGYYLIDRSKAIELAIKKQKYDDNYVFVKDYSVFKSNEEFFLTNYKGDKDTNYKIASLRNVYKDNLYKNEYIKTNQNAIYNLITNELNYIPEPLNYLIRPYSLLPDLNKYLNEISSSYSYECENSKLGYFKLNIMNFTIYITSSVSLYNSAQRTYIFDNDGKRLTNFWQISAINFIKKQIEKQKRK